jgi:hypothetical protein
MGGRIVAVFRGCRSFCTAKAADSKIGPEAKKGGTVFVHSFLHALLQSARLALVTMRFVDHAVARSRLTSVDQSSSNTPLEETGATVARQNS